MKSYIKCSFCQQEQDKAGTLVQGTNVYICNRCIDACYNVIHPRDFPPRSDDDVQIDILEGTVYRVVVQGSVGHDVFKEMQEWNKENMASLIHMNVDKRSFEFIFQYKTDAMAFKLKWL